MLNVPIGVYRLNPYWVSRGLTYVLNGKTFITKNGARTVRGISGGPKLVASPAGQVLGVGSTFGTGTSDSLTGPDLLLSEGFRSIVAKYFANSAGGGNVGRIFQPSTGAGDTAEGVFPTSTTRMAYIRAASGGNGQWGLAGGTIVLGAWKSFGVTHDQRSTSNTPLLYEDGILGSVTTVATPSGAFVTGPYSPMFGNRAANNRGWDGLIGLTLVFDHPTQGLTAQEQMSLHLNPWQVFESPRQIWVAPGGGGATLALTGVQATGDVGTVGVSVAATRALTGNQATGQAGSVGVAADATLALTGNQATGAVGSVGVSVSASQALTGNQSTGAVGTVTPSTGTVLALTGNEGTGQVGSVAGSTATSIALTGNGAAGQVGSVSPATGASASLTGVSATGAVGDVAAFASFLQALTGNQAAGQVGSVIVGGDKTEALTGVSGVGGVGSVGVPGAGVGDYGGGKPKKKRFVVERNGKLLVFNTANAAVRAIPDLPEVPTPKQIKKVEAVVAEVLRTEKPQQTIEVAQIKDSRVDSMLQQRNYEALVNLYQEIQEREEDDIAALLMSF